MLGAVNRMDGANRDWNQANTTAKTTTEKLPMEIKMTGFMNENRFEKGEIGEADKEKIFKEVEKVNNQLKAQNHSFRFKFSEEADQFYMQIIDMRTQEVVESVPSEHMIELAAKLKDMIGFFVDKKL